MKQHLYIIIAIFFSTTMSAQVGIGIQTEYPKQLLHIDPLRDTDKTGLSGFDDDFVIDGNGQFGVGTLAPTAKLDIRTSFRFNNGFQGNDKIFMSDSNGSAKWGDRSKLEIVEVDNIDVILSGKTFTTTPQYTGIEFTLPEGLWQVMFQVTCNAVNNVFWDVCDSPSTHSLIDDRNRRGVSSGTNPATVTAIYFVENTVETKHYIWATTEEGTATYLASGTLWAMPIE